MAASEKRKKLWSFVAIIVVIVIIILAVVLLMAGNKAPTYNVAQVYVTTWGMASAQAEPIDVKFRVLLDLDGDQAFEVNRSSAVFTNTTFELAPFNLGGPINTNVKQFHFKVEVVRMQDGNESVLWYDGGTLSPTNTGVNEEGGSGSWSYPQDGHAVSECTVQYAYYIN
jgi:hypothetical protein